MIKTLEPNQIPQKYHRWTGNDEQGHYHRRLHISETPYILHLSWREHCEAKIHSIGYYELDLPALLAEEYIREDGAGYVRVRFVHEDNGNIFLQTRQNAPRLLVGSLLRCKDLYRQLVRRVFEEIAATHLSTNELKTELVCDEERGHYHLGEVGWEGEKRIDDVFLHADILNSKVWIQRDDTDLTLADYLIDAGIPRGHIVLAFHPPHLRQYTDYAAA